MNELTVAKWMPTDDELQNFYKGVHEFVVSHVNVDSAQKYNSSKVIIDPCVGYIEFYPWEVTLIDTHIFQQLRKITQLGLAYLVFPTLRYSRFEHTLGVVGRLNQMLQKLKAKHKNTDTQILQIIDKYETIVRLAALFHDVGHCLFSHLSESVINELQGNEIEDLKSDKYYPSTKTIKEKFSTHFNIHLNIAEIFSLVIMSNEVFVKLLKKAGLKESASPLISTIDEENIPIIIENAARFIAGIPIKDKNDTIFLAQLISSGLDADKLDYMSREEHFSGIKVEMDLERILNKIKVQKIKKNFELQPGLEKYAKHLNSTGEYYVLCIERGGQFAYEEFCVARLALYEKIYLHKKVRAAEQTLKRELGKIPLQIKEFSFAHNWLYLPESIVENETKLNVTKVQNVINLNLFGEKEDTRRFIQSSYTIKIDMSLIEKRIVPHRAFAFGPANATYDSNYYNLLDNTLLEEDMEYEINRLVSVRFWKKLLDQDGIIEYIKGIEQEGKYIIEKLLKNPNTIKSLLYKKSDLESLLKIIDEGFLPLHLIIDVPDYNRVILSFETLHFEESSFQTVRWTIPIHRISHYYQLHRILAYVYFDKKFADLICFACEKAALTFSTKFFKNERQIYEQRNFISHEIYLRHQNLKKEFYKIDENYFKTYEELKPPNEELDNDHTVDVINKILVELNYYYKHKFQIDLKYQNVVNYLNQFDNTLQGFVLKILSSIKVIHEKELDKLFEEVLLLPKNQGDKINVIPLGTSFSSANEMMPHFEEIFTKYNIDNHNIESEKILDYSHFIFYDDNTNSGRQSFNIIATWCGLTSDELKKKGVYTDIKKHRDAMPLSESLSQKIKDAKSKITLCFITGTKEAESFLHKYLKEICQIKGEIFIKIKYYMTQDSAIFNPNESPKSDNILIKLKRDFDKVRSVEASGVVEKTKSFLTDIGIQLVKNKDICLHQSQPPENHALGYCNRQSTVIFFNSVPTATITALWCSGKYRDKNGELKDWKPLIPRYKE